MSGTLASPAGPATGEDRSGPDLRRRRLLVLITVGAVVLAGLAVALLRGSGGADGIAVDDVRAGQSTGQAAAVYLDLTPTGGEDVLIGASTSAARRVSLHEAETTDGLTTMRVTEEIPLPEGRTTALEPGGSHLMLEVLEGPLEPGDRLELTLEFARTGSRTIEVAVVGLSDLLEEP